MALPETMAPSEIRGANISRLIESYDNLWSHSGLDLASEAFIATFLYSWYEIFQDTVKMMNWELWHVTETVS